MWCSVIETQTDRSLILISHSMMSFTCGGPPEPHSFRALKHMKGQRSSSVEEGTEGICTNSINWLYIINFDIHSKCTVPRTLLESLEGSLVLRLFNH